MPTLVLTTLCKSSVFTPDSLLRSENWQSHTCELTDGWYLLWSVSVGRLWWDWEVSEMKGGQKSVTEEKEPGVVTDCHCCYTVTKSCLTLCNPRDCSTPGSLVLHCLPEFAQVHVHWVSDAILIISSSAASIVRIPSSNCSSHISSSSPSPSPSPTIPSNRNVTSTENFSPQASSPLLHSMALITSDTPSIFTARPPSLRNQFHKGAFVYVIHCCSLNAPKSVSHIINTQ